MIGEYVAASIKVIPNAIDYSDEIISVAKSAPKEAWRDSAVGGQAEYNNSIRRSNEISIRYGLMSPRIFFNVAQDIYGYAKDYAKENGFRFTHMEGISLLEYLPNDGFFDLHSDSDASFPRSMSALLYLNDVEEGGETWFDKFGINVKPEKGKLVLFPANYAYTHQALPPVSGNKYVAVTWFGMELNDNVFEVYYRDHR